MTFKRLAVTSALILSATASLAQTPGEAIEVRVVNVDVVVRDRAGKPVTGLTRADFEIYENNQKREITNLYEVRATTAPTAKPAQGAASNTPPPVPETAVEIRPRNIVMFVDNYSLQPFRRDKILQSLLKFVDEKLQPQDRVMLIVCTQKANVITPFTTDRKAVHSGVESIRKTVGAGQNRAAALDQLKGRVNQFIDAANEPKLNKPTLSITDAYSMSSTMVDAFVDEEILNSRSTLNALSQTIGSLSGLEGKSVIIFAGAQMPEKPGKETYQWLYNAYSRYIPSLTMSSEFLNGRAGSMQRYSIEEAAKAASANNIALYTIDGADSRDSVSAENREGVETTEQFASFTNSAAAYQTLARISGGLAIANTDNFDSAFQTLGNDLSSYYSLGFKPASSANGDPHNIVVKMKNPEYRFRARETYFPKTSSNGDEMSARVIANLYNSDPHSAWQVELKPGTPQKEGNQFRVPFELSIPSTITLLPQDSDLAGGFTVYIVVGSGGKTSQVIKSPHPVKIPSEVEDQFRTVPMTYKATIIMTPGENTLSVGIIDQTSNTTGFARAKVVIP